MTAERTARFRDLHVAGTPLLMPNPWDAGSAKILAGLGFAALATTSGGHAASIGLPDGTVTRGLALAHAATMVAAVDVPVSADLEHGFGDDPAGVAGTVAGAVEVGLAGCSTEDWTGTAVDDRDRAAARVAAAVEAAGDDLVLTARAENHIRGNPDLDDTVDRLRAYEDAGAHVLYAPGVIDLADVERVVDAVERPVNVLLRPGSPTVAELAGVGVARISVGAAFHLAALGALGRAARELLDDGTHGYLDLAAEGKALATDAIG